MSTSMSFQSETKILEETHWGTFFDLTEVEPLLGLLAFNKTITVEKVELAITFLAYKQDELWLTGPLRAGLVAKGHFNHIKGTPAMDKTKANKLHGLVPVVTPGSAQNQTVVVTFSPRNGKIFEVSDKLSPLVMVSMPSSGAATGKTGAMIALLATVYVTMSD